MRSDLIERHIAYHQVQRVPLYQHFGNITDDDFFLRVELFHNPAGNTVYLNGGEFAIDLRRHHADKVTDSGTEFAKFACAHSGFSGNLPYKVDQEFRRIMAVESRGSCRNVFFRCQYIPQFRIFFGKLFIFRIKYLRNTTPTTILNQDFKLFIRGGSAGFFQLFQQTDCGDIGGNLMLCSGRIKDILGSNTVVLAFFCDWNYRFYRYRLRFDSVF